MSNTANRAKPALSAAMTGTSKTSSLRRKTSAASSQSGSQPTTRRKTTTTSQNTNTSSGESDSKRGGTNHTNNDGPQKLNSGTRPTTEEHLARPNIRPPQLTCDCGKTYASTSTFARHRKGGCAQRSRCLHCEQSFPTFAGLRQHEKRAHPAEYTAELEAKLPVSDAIVLEQLAEIEARSDTGYFYKEMVEVTGLTKHQIRHRREKPEYGAYLKRARKKLSDRGDDSPAHMSSPQTPPSARQGRTLLPRTLTARDTHPQDDRVPVIRLARVQRTGLPPVREATPPSPSSGDNTSSSSESEYSPTTETESESLPSSATETRSSLATETEDLAPRNRRRIAQASPDPPSNLLRQRRLSRSLPAVPCADETDPFEDHLRELMINLEAKHPSVANLIHTCLTSPATELTPILEQWLTEYFSDRSRKKVPRQRDAPKAYGQRDTGRGLRAATYKKAQDLYLKDRSTLAAKVLSGKPLMEEDTYPSVPAVEGLYAEIYENPGPGIAKRVEAAKPSGRLFYPVTPAEIFEAKKNWHPSAPGPDGIQHRTVRQCDNDILSALYSLVIYKNIPIPSWNEARTVLIYKDGDREDPGNWRPITVGSMVQRLLHRLLARRMKSAVSLNINQRGFVDGDGTLANSLILHHYITTRHREGKSYNVLSLDIRKAFDSVTHCALERALQRHDIDARMRAYIVQSLTNSTTTIKSGRHNTRPINIRRGVRQGDPLSPLLFNLVLDELMDNLQGPRKGGTIAQDTKCSVLAFADDLVLLEDKDIDIPIALDRVTQFMEARGMQLNPKKCVSLSATTRNGKAVVRTTPQFRIGQQWISQASAMNPFKYLGHSIGPSGIGKPNVANLTQWLRNTLAAPLKPDQKLEIIRTYILPRLHYGFQTPGITAKSLKEADRLLRRAVKQAVHLHVHTSDAAIHAKLRDGGLGVLDLRSNVPRIFLGRLVGLLDRVAQDNTLSAVLQHQDSTALFAKLSDMAGEVAADQKWRKIIQSQPTTTGLDLTNEDSASRSWLTEKPRGWTGRDFVRAIHLRTANLPTAAIPSRPPEERFCRGGCGCLETLNHVLQKCPITHYERIDRHNEIAKKLANHCRNKHWQVEEEPHVRHNDGQLFKPDLVIHKADLTVVADVQVSWEGNRPMGVIWDEKKRVYDNAKFREAASKRWPNRELVFTPVILGARGIWPRANEPAVDHLEIHQGLKNSCVHSSLKWGPSIHRAFMKCVWKRNGGNVEPRPTGRRLTPP